MFAALILAISIVTLMRFALSYWRAILIGASAQPVSEEVRAAAQVEGGISAKDFNALAGICRIVPGGSSGLACVSLYYRTSRAIQSVVGQRTAFARWGEREMAICAHYVGVRIDQRLQLSFDLSQPSGSC